MLDTSKVLASRPRPPARNSLPQQHKNNTNNPTQTTNTELTESPLSQVAKLLQERRPGTVEFKSSRSFIEAWSYNNPEHIQHELNQHLEEEVQQEDNQLDQNSITHEWVSAKTREELEALLLAADRVIRERERDLGIAASIGKSLLENNIALRARQEKLLAHISATSLPASPTNQPFEDLVNRSEYIEARPPPSPSDYELRNNQLELSLDLTPSPQTQNNQHQRYTQQSVSNRSTLFPYCLRPENSPRSSLSSVSSDRIKHLRVSPHPGQQGNSASPTTLNRLTQQNEYLAQQLSDLQTETEESELEGRKRLRKLVKELETLRVELRQAEERNALLEEERFPHFEQQNNNMGHMVDEIVGDMKRVMMDDRDIMIKMYTPAKSTASITRDMHLPAQQQSTPINPTSNLPTSYIQSPSSFLSSTSKRSSVSNQSRSSLEFQTSPQERALVSQLLAKIAELKDSQTEFEQEREEMKAKLQRAQEEVEELQSLVEEAELELQQARQLGWEGHRGLIEWDTQQDHTSQSIPSSSKKASGNRKMINQSRKAKKRQWPAPEHHPGSIGSDIVLPDSNVSSTYGGGDPGSPSFRGQALSMARQNSIHREYYPENGSSHTESVIRIGDSTRSIFWSTNDDGGGSVRGGETRDHSHPAPPLRTLLSEINGLYPDQSNVENKIFKTNNMSDPSDEEHNPVSSPVVYRYISTDKKSDSTATSGSSKRTTQATYTELQREVAETPLSWADENVNQGDNQSSTQTNERPRRLANSRKRDSTNWLYRMPSTGPASQYLESWSSDRSLTVSNRSPDPSLRHSQLLIEGRHHPTQEDGQSSTISSSTTIGRISPSKNHLPYHHGKKPSPHQCVVSRREEALKRLGISSFAGPSGSSDANTLRNNEDEEEEEGVEGWNYIDSIDLDSQQELSHMEYSTRLMTMRERGMMMNRLYLKTSSWGTFVYQWMKLVSVVGLAVGWAVWQGPRSALEDEFTGFLINDHDDRNRNRNHSYVAYHHRNQNSNGNQDQNLLPSRIRQSSLDSLGSSTPPTT